MVTIASPFQAYGNAFSQGMAQGDQVGQMAQRQQIQNLYRTQGQGIARGDQNALDALAAIDPMAAMDARNSQAQYQATQQNMQISRENLQIARAEAARATQEAAAKMTAAEAAKASAHLQTIMQGAMMAPDEGAYNAWLVQNKVDPARYPFAQRDLHAAAALGSKEVLDFRAAQADLNAPPEPADEYERYARDEKAAGRQPLSRIDYKKAGSPSMVVETGPNGTVVRQGVGASDATSPGITTNAMDPATLSGDIDAILNDPALPRVVGPVQGGGGNNIDDLGVMQRAYYGKDGLALIERIGQLQSKTWLDARALLKGGGAITDYESRKAENAMSRLSRAKGEEEFKAALVELKDAITTGLAKLQAAQPAAGGQGSQPAPASTPDAPVTFEDAFGRYGTP
jgi:hypothetical protein